MQWYLSVLKNYVGFSGRARRTEYWMFVLFNFIISIVLTVLDMLAGLNSVLNYLYALAVLLPGLAVTFRRLHDTGRSGWWVLISLIPLIGAIVLLIFTLLDSDAGENKYGHNPKFSE